MPVILHDTRNASAMSVAEADKLFARIATDEIELARVALQFEKRIAAIKADADAVLGPIKARIGDNAKVLAAYITAHKDDRFVKPRNRKTSFGTYGIRAVSNLEITDMEALMADLKSKGLKECYEVYEKVIKGQVSKRLDDGVQLEGAEVRTGIRAEYKVDKALIEDALQRAG